MSAYVLLNLLNELDKKRYNALLAKHFIIFPYEFINFNNTGARMLDSVKITLKSHFCR